MRSSSERAGRGFHREAARLRPETFQPRRLTSRRYRALAHFGIEVVVQLFRLENAFDIHLWARAAGLGLDRQCRKTQPLLDDVSGEVDILDTRIGEMDF